MDDDSTYAAYQRELAPYRDDYLAQVNAAWGVYLASVEPAKEAYLRAKSQLRGKYRLDDWLKIPYDGWRVTGAIGPIRD